MPNGLTFLSPPEDVTEKGRILKTGDGTFLSLRKQLHGRERLVAVYKGCDDIRGQFLEAIRIESPRDMKKAAKRKGFTFENYYGSLF